MAGGKGVHLPHSDMPTKDKRGLAWNCPELGLLPLLAVLTQSKPWEALQGHCVEVLRPLLLRSTWGLQISSTWPHSGSLCQDQ
jgi:hypothetical protein